MSILEMILYPLLTIAMIIWLVVIIRKYKKRKRNLKNGIEDEDE